MVNGHVFSIGMLQFVFLTKNLPVNFLTKITFGYFWQVSLTTLSSLRWRFLVILWTQWWPSWKGRKGSHRQKMGQEWLRPKTRPPVTAPRVSQAQSQLQSPTPTPSTGLGRKSSLSTGQSGKRVPIRVSPFWAYFWYFGSSLNRSIKQKSAFVYKTYLIYISCLVFLKLLVIELDK